MGNISSAHFKKSTEWQLKHNIDVRPSYAIGGKLEFNRNSEEALKLKNQITQQAIDTYNRTKKPKAPAFKAKSYEWSLVVNLKENNTLEDCEQVAKMFAKDYGFQCYQIVIHRDEGHIDELGNKRINHHAHLEFITLDKETGKNRFRAGFATPKNFSAIQNKVAQILEMERGAEHYKAKQIAKSKGETYKIPKRIEPRAYGAMKEREKAERKADLEKINDLKADNTILEQMAESTKQEHDRLKTDNATLKEENTALRVENIFLNREKEQLLTTKEIKELLESFRKQCIGKGLPKEFFRALSAEKQSPKQSTKQELELFCADLLRAYENKNNELQNLENELRKERDLRKKAENDRARLVAELESKNTQNRDFKDNKVAAPVTQKSTETTQSVEITQKTEPKIDAPVKEQKPAKISIDEALSNALTSANCKNATMYWHTSEENSLYVKDISTPKAEIIKDKMESQGFFVAYSEDKSNRIAINGVKWNITLIVSNSKEVFEKAKEWLYNRLGSLIYKTATDTFQERIAKIDKALIETKKSLTPKETLQEQMKEQVKKAVYNQRETQKRDLGISR